MADEGKTKKPGKRRRRFWAYAALLIVCGALVLLTPLILHVMYAGVFVRKYGLSEKGLEGVGRAAMHYFAYFMAALPTDEEMISHFKVHRKDFERLVDLYQSEDHGKVRVYDDIGRWVSSRDIPEMKSLLERTGIRSLSAASTGGLWLPDPYSPDAAERAKKENMVKAYRYHAIIFNPADRKKYIIPSLLYRSIGKSLFYVPVHPKVENGQLWWPPVEPDGKPYLTRPVVHSLDFYAWEWRGDTSLYRQIDDQWFIHVWRAR